MSTRLRHLHGPWPHRFYAHRSYIRGISSGLCPSRGRSRPCRSSSGPSASSRLSTFGICAHLVVSGLFPTGSCTWNSDPWQRPVQSLCFAGSRGLRRPSIQRTRLPCECALQTPETEQPAPDRHASTRQTMNRGVMYNPRPSGEEVRRSGVGETHSAEFFPVSQRFCPSSNTASVHFSKEPTL